MWKENGYQESITSEIFNRIPSSHRLSVTKTNASQLSKRRSINLPYVEGTSEKLRQSLKSLKITSTFLQ